MWRSPGQRAGRLWATESTVHQSPSPPQVQASAMMSQTERQEPAGLGRRLKGGAVTAHGVEALVQLRAKALGACELAQAEGVRVADHHFGFHLARPATLPHTLSALAWTHQRLVHGTLSSPGPRGRQGTCHSQVNQTSWLCQVPLMHGRVTSHAHSRTACHTNADSCCYCSL